MKKAILLLPIENRDRIYGQEHVESLRKFVTLTDCCEKVGDLDALRPHLADAEIVCSGWGMMTLDEAFLSAAPALKAVFYGAGSVRGFVTEEFWKSGILLTNASSAIAVSVAEWTVAMIVLTASKAFDANRRTREARRFMRPEEGRGLYRAKVGIIGVGMVGRKVLEILKRYEVEKLCYDPYVSEKELRNLGVEPVELDEMFRTCDVVSLHAPNIPATQHMITGRHFRSMKEGAAFINTARGQLVKEDEMIAELKKGRIFACIDVTDPEPPPPDSALYDMPNVFLTPHLAGGVGANYKRLGATVVEEVKRYCSDDPPAHPVAREMMEWMA